MSLTGKAGNLWSALAALILFDLALIWDRYRHGPPVSITADSDQVGVLTFHIQRVPVPPWNWISLAALVGLHFLLIFLTWKRRHRRVDSRQP
jgi:hypothetical protein